MLFMNIATFGDCVIDPTRIMRPIQRTPADRWKMFLALTSDLHSQSFPYISSIFARCWLIERTGQLWKENSHLPHIFASAVHLSDRRPARHGRSGCGLATGSRNNFDRRSILDLWLQALVDSIVRSGCRASYYSSGALKMEADDFLVAITSKRQFLIGGVGLAAAVAFPGLASGGQADQVQTEPPKNTS